jgi:predicted transcriptional regulator
LDLKELLASKGRQKIIEILAKYREMNVMHLVNNKVGGRYNDVNRNLIIMEKEGIIINEYRKQVRRAKIRIIKLNMENFRAQKLLKALKILDDSDTSTFPQKVIL